MHCISVLLLYGTFVQENIFNSKQFISIHLLFLKLELVLLHVLLRKKKLCVGGLNYQLFWQNTQIKFYLYPTVQPKEPSSNGRVTYKERRLPDLLSGMLIASWGRRDSLILMCLPLSWLQTEKCYWGGGEASTPMSGKVSHQSSVAENLFSCVAKIILLSIVTSPTTWDSRLQPRRLTTYFY